MKRLFIAIDIIPEDQESINAFRSLHSQPYQEIPQQNFHLTLLFLDDINEASQIELINQINALSLRLSNEARLTLSLSQTLHFNKPKILSLAPSTVPNWLNELHQGLCAIADKLGLTSPCLEYKPHVSIYREATALTNFSVALTLKIKSFSLYHSKLTNSVAYYQKLKTWQLRRIISEQ